MFKKISVILLVFIFVSCEGIVTEKEGLNNAADQAEIDQLSTNITKNNYTTRVSNITSVYGNRIRTIGLNSGTANYILNTTFEVWPKKSNLNSSQILSGLRNEMGKYRFKAKRKTAKGINTSAFDVMLQSEEADTAFSKIEKQFLKDAYQIFGTKDKRVSDYTLELNKLTEKYRVEYELTDKEFATITGISESVGTFITTLHQAQAEGELVELLDKKKNLEYASIYGSVLFLLQQANECNTEEAKENYTAPDCGFEEDWGEIGGAATLGAALGMLGTTSRLAYYGLAGTVFPAGSAAGAASDFAISGVSGAARSAVIRWLDQYRRHREWLEQHAQ